jgi:hypothetical protein
MHVRLVIRPGNAPLSGGEEYSAVHGLAEI